MPRVDGSELARRIFTAQAWSVLPCVRPLAAVHMTAGHNALRGSGPGQNRAFDDAVAQVGCPDRQIDRLCIACCSPFPTLTSRRLSGAISLPRKRCGLLVPLPLGHHGPGHPRVPAIAEFVSGYEVSAVFGLGAKATQVEIIDKLNAAINDIISDQKIRERLAELGGTALTLSPTKYRELIAEETEKWASVIRAANIRLE
jgi:Tripartite tricarboxylate transporter family receptor